MSLPIGNPFNDLWSFVTQPFASLAGWAGDTIFEGITNWIARGCVQLLEFVWTVMDRTSTPQLNAEWFSQTPTSPFQVAARLGGPVLLTVFFVAVAHGIATGDVGGVVRRAFIDLPFTVFVMVSLITLTTAAIRLSDAMSDTIWQGTRGNAINVFDGLGRTAAALRGASFLAPLVLLVLMVSLLFLWFVLMLRDVLIYLVVVLAVAFGLPGMVWPALRGMARHTVELLVALIVAKPVIALALSVGIGALGGIGATGQPGAGTVDNGLAEFSTLVVGIITFGLAAFMPYLVYRLLPVAAAAGVAAGVASGPLRAASTGMQFQYYAQSTMQRLSTNQTANDGTLEQGSAAGGTEHASGGGGGGSVGADGRLTGATNGSTPTPTPTSSAGGGANGAATAGSGVPVVAAVEAAKKAASVAPRTAKAVVASHTPGDET